MSYYVTIIPVDMHLVKCFTSISQQKSWRVRKQVMQGEEKYLTTKEACEFLGVTRRSLERYAEQGRITRYKRGITRAVYYKQSELARLLEYRPENDAKDQ